MIYVSSPDFFGKLEGLHFGLTPPAMPKRCCAPPPGPTCSSWTIWAPSSTHALPHQQPYSLLNNRLGAKLPTIVTTNITDGALLEKRYTEKISSRLSAFMSLACLQARTSALRKRRNKKKIPGRAQLPPAGDL